MNSVVYRLFTYTEYFRRKKMKKLLLLVAVITVFALSGCALFSGKSVSVTIDAKLNDASSLGFITRAVNPGDPVTEIDAYRVIFKKVEIGNSEDEKFTLWENADGEQKDIAGDVSFTDTNKVVPGVYNYLRLTIGTVLSVDGSIYDSETSTTYTGSGSCELDNEQYLWGTDIDNFQGEITLQDPIVISGDSSIAFTFDITDTVFYLSGDSANAVLEVKKPVVTIGVE